MKSADNKLKGERKMASQAQTEANRQNAQKSTGPRTPEGKAAVSRNAIKHGLFTNDAIIAGENIEDYNLNKELLIDEFNPVGRMETILVERIVTLTWRLKRIERFQNIVIDAMIDNEVHDPIRRNLRRHASDGSERHKEIQNNANYVIGNTIIDDYKEPLVLDRLSIYERRIESSLYKTMAELRRLQHVRKQMEHQKAQTEQTSESRQAANEEREMNDERRSRSDEVLSTGIFHGLEAHNTDETKYEKQSQSFDIAQDKISDQRLETRSIKPEILNKV